MNAIARKRAIAAVVLAWAAVAQGGPVELKAIPAGAKWLAHVDLDAARSSQVTKAFLQARGKDCQRRFAAGQVGGVFRSDWQ